MIPRAIPASPWVVAVLCLGLFAPWAATSPAAPGDEFYSTAFRRCGADASIRALLESEGVLYFGGHFQHIPAIKSPVKPAVHAF